LQDERRRELESAENARGENAGREVQDIKMPDRKRWKKVETCNVNTEIAGVENCGSRIVQVKANLAQTVS